MSDNVLDEIGAVDMKRSAVIRKMEELRGELKHLDAERARISTRADLPTVPGWYVTADDTPARLDENGVWDDGWGNSGPDYTPAWHPLPLTRLVPKENPNV